MAVNDVERMGRATRSWRVVSQTLLAGTTPGRTKKQAGGAAAPVSAMNLASITAAVSMNVDCFQTVNAIGNRKTDPFAGLAGSYVMFVSCRRRRRR